MPPPIPRKSYTAKLKLSAVAYANENGNRAAGRHFNVSEKVVRDWRKAASVLKSMKSSKKANRGKKARWPQLEDRLRTWILEQRAAGRGLSTVQVRLKAQTLAKEMNVDDFVGGPSWCFRFMRRHQLVIRARTTACQKLPDDFQEKMASFQAFVKEKIQDHDVSPSHIVNMDEVPLTFDIPMGKTVAEKGENTISLRTTGHEKSHFTVVLACCADGTKLPPMIIFKRKTMPKDVFPSGVVVQCNVKGWMDVEMMGLWLEKCFSRRPDAFFHTKKGLLVMDSMRAHMTDLIKTKIKSKNCIPVIIPGGMTKMLQPLDIAVNRSFKAILRRLWEAWMTDGDHSFTKTGRMRHASLSEVAEWVNEAWNSVPVKTVTTGFKKAGLIDSVPEIGAAETDYSSGPDDDEEEPTGLDPGITALFQSDSESEEYDAFTK